MNTTFRFKLAAFTFAGLLVLPTFDQVLDLSASFRSTENRRQSGMPALELVHIRSFARQFGQYYKENFGWRNALFYAYSRWKLNVLGLSPLPEKVIVGKQGWFYLGNSYNHVMDQHRGLMPLSADSAQLIARHLAKRQQQLARQGVRLYVMIAPDSHTIYPEHLPDQLTPAPVPTRLDVLRQAMATTTVPFVDIRDTLLDAKRREVVYYQTDTHWNDYGSLIGSVALLNTIRRAVPALPPARLSDYQIEKQGGLGGDLTTMLTVQREHKDPVFFLITPSPARQGRRVAEVPNPELGFPSTRFVKADADTAGLPRLLFIGDSFSHSMMQFVSGYFQSSYFIRGHHLDQAAITAEQPTVLVVEVVERNIGDLATL
ncbi:alginate O-acetyltransferase AlgX-related protein [Spirosoma luteolum]